MREIETVATAPCHRPMMTYQQQQESDERKQVAIAKLKHQADEYNAKEKDWNVAARNITDSRTYQMHGECESE